MNRLKVTVLALFLPLLLLACAAPPAAAPTAAPAATAAPAQPTATPAPAVAPAAATPAPAAVAAASGPTVKVASDAKLGSLLADAKGMTLYMYTKDDNNVSNCYDQCATNWPPLLVASGEPMAPTSLPGILGLTTRKDNSKQVTYNGMPLYFWAKDTNPGDTTGQNVGTVWFVVPPTMSGFPTIKPGKDAKLGEILTDKKGMTLYRFTKDEANVTNCYDQCAQNWPPLLVAGGEPIAPVGLSGKLGVITRKDGTKQVTYNGLPLYYWVKDAKPGDATGEGVNDVWHVVQPNSGAPAVSAPAYNSRY